MKAASAPAGGPAIGFAGSMALPEGGWIAARVVGPVSRYVSDSYAFAQTSPVYVVAGGKRYSSAADAEFLGRVVDAIWQRLEGRSTWRSAAGKEAFRREIEQARAVYRRLAEGSR